MKISILGSGLVGRNLAARLSEVGHELILGTRNPVVTAERDDVAQWRRQHPAVSLATFPKAARSAEVVFNAVAGIRSLDALREAGAANLDGKVLIDLALPLDLSRGLPPTLVVANDDSLGEQIQRALPRARVVKTLNSVYTEVMVDPARLPGSHNLFLSGEDAVAKEVAASLLEQLGWPRADLIDLGGIVTARAVEMYSQLYFALVGALDTFDLNISVVRR